MQIAARTTGGLIKIEVTTNGSSYTSPPSVTITGGGGTGAQAVAHMDGGRVESVVITNAGTGYSSAPTIGFSSGDATAVAYVATTLRPMSFFRGRYLSLYGVDGTGRGIRYILRAPHPTGLASILTVNDDIIVTENDDTFITAYGYAEHAQPLGINKPAVGPAMTAQTATGSVISAIQLVRGGAGYAGTPTVTLEGGTPTVQAKARAIVAQGRVDRIFLTDNGLGYQSAPSVVISGGLGAQASFNVGVLGSVSALTVINAGTGYTSNATTAPTVVLHNTQGLTSFLSRVTVDERGELSAVDILSGGTGATASGITASVTGGGGTGAVLGVRMNFQVNAVTVAASGENYFVPPVVTIRRDPSDTLSVNSVVEASVNVAGNISGVTVLAGGAYSIPPTALIADSSAQAQATLRPPLRGAYYCCIRYFDDTPVVENGPVYSSISELIEVDTGDGQGSLVWAFSHYGVDERVVGMELWRTSADQKTLLFRVATIYKTDANWSTTYHDTVNDIDLTDTARPGYGLMPITLPSGQVNARRFTVPTGEFALGCMFQDRAWYAKDMLDIRPNSLLFSEIDEPESVPITNEIVLQENSVVADTIQALVPLGPSLLICQRTHIYKLMYVAQPIIDASITLVSYRGVLHDRCVTVMAGVAFLVDSHGMYAYDGSAEEAISAPVDDYWRDGVIDFSKVDKFHVSSDFLLKVVRFHFCKSADSEPIRALCYCTATKAWWEETYPVARTASSSSLIGEKWTHATADALGGLQKHTGLSDSGALIPYELTTGPMALDEGPSRSVAVVYKPTPNRNDLNVTLRYNNSASPRQNAIASDRGSGFVSAGTVATLNMAATRSPLGDANGFARAYVSGRRDDRAVGGDRHMAIGMHGTQSATAANDGVVIYALQIDGVG